MKKRKYYTVRAMFFKYYFLLMLIVILSLGIFFYQHTSQMMVSRILDSAQKLAVSISGQLDLEIRKMDTVSVNVAYSNLVRDQFALYLYEMDDTVSRYRYSKLLTDVFTTISGPFLTVQQVNLYDFHGNAIGAGYFNGPIKVDLENQPWYRETLSLDGKKYISKPYNNAFFVRSAYKNRFFLSLYRVYFNNFRERVGIIETVKDYDSIFATLNKVVNSGSDKMEIYVFDVMNELIYPASEEAVEFPAHFNQVKDALNQESQIAASSILDFEARDRKLVAHASSEYTGWTVCIAQPAELAMLPINQFAKFVTLVIVGMSLLSLLLSFLASDRITGPISRFNHIIKNIAFETLNEGSTHIPDSNVKEIKELYTAFNAMRSKLKESMDSVVVAKQKETEAKFSALQYQINPHFLRNCLTNISIMAEEGDVEAVTSMCKNISNMLYYVCKSGPSVVRLETEMDYIEKYLECIKLRYGESLKYEINIEENAKNIMIPKLLVQPLVENAVEHGTNVDPPWIIKVAVTSSNMCWKVRVEDNGFGFDHEKLMFIEEKVEKIKKGNRPLDTEHADFGIGLLNVFLRLYVTYGDSAIFEIKNKPNGGALVIIGGTLKITTAGLL